MNILFSCDEYPPAKTGGIGSATKIVCETLAARGHHVYVVSGRLPGHGLPTEAIIHGVTIYRVTYFSKLSCLLNTPKKSQFFNRLFVRFGLLASYAIKQKDMMFDFIERLIKEKQIDIIELPDYTILDKYYIKRKFAPAHKYSVPCVGRVHGSCSFLEFNYSMGISPLTRRNNISFFEHCDKILAVSKFSADFVNRELEIKNKCDVIYNPVNTSFIEQAQKLDVKRENKIVFLGKVIETKGAFNLLKAFETFSKSYPKYKLVMIGDGEIDKAKTLVTLETLQNVEFTGYLNRDKIAVYLKSAAFCVIPTFFETLSVAAIEVMGCGNILIFTTAASGPEIITDGVDGFLVDPHSVEDIQNKMSFIAENLKALIPMRQKAIETIEARFKQDFIIDQLENYYMRIVGQHKV